MISAAVSCYDTEETFVCQLYRYRYIDMYLSHSLLYFSSCSHSKRAAEQSNCWAAGLTPAVPEGTLGASCGELPFSCSCLQMGFIYNSPVVSVATVVKQEG